MVFFFKQKTAYEMRISDWSSDVCSSDLAERTVIGKHAQCVVAHHAQARPGLREALAQRRIRFASTHSQCAHHPFKFMREMHPLTQRRDAAPRFGPAHRDQIGRAAWREREYQYVSISVVAVYLKKTRNNTT